MAQLKGISLPLILFGAALAEGCRNPKGRVAISIAAFGYLLVVIGGILLITGAIFE